MTDFLETLRATTLLVDGATGSYLFERTARPSETNHVYEALNLHNPEIVREVHLTYLQAGARCLTTNTFGANATQLGPLGEGGHVDEINRAGVRLACDAIAAFRRQTHADGPHYVLGSVGPTLTASESPDEAGSIYREQIDALLAEGVDALLFETFASLAHVKAVLDIVGRYEDRPPVVVQMALHYRGVESAWDQDPVSFVQTAADMGAQVVGVNCCAPWEVLAFLDAVQDMDVVKDGRVLLSAMPNAGGYQRIGRRYMTHVNPEYMGKLARTFSERGVQLVGGCCEVHPPHISEMDNYLRGIGVGRKAAPRVSARDREPVGDETKKANGPFSRKVKEGEFAVSVEVLPPRGTGPKNLQTKVDLIAELAASGLADALDITDGSRGIPLMPPGDFIGVIRERLGWVPDTGDGLEFIPHFAARDLNVMALQSRLIGYHARRIHNVLFIIGDPPKMSPGYPRSTAVFDLDTVDIIRYTHSCLNSGVDFGGQPLGRHLDPRTHFTIGSGFEPEAVNLERELDKLRRKIDGDADYIMTQPVFRFEALDVLEPFRSQVPVLAGVMILGGLEHARRVGEIPGVVVPQAVYERMGAYSRVEDQAKLGREIAVEQVRWVREQGWAGLYLMSQASFRTAIDVLREVS